MNLNNILAIAKKTFLLNIRYKFAFFIESWAGPFRTGILFFFLYTGFFYAGAKNIGDVNKENYILFLLIGILFSGIFTVLISKLSNSFFGEKYWKTIQGFILSPASTFDLIFGLGLGNVPTILPIILITFLGAILLKNISFVMFILSIIFLILFIIIILGYSLIIIAFVLSNESILAIFNVVNLVLNFVSCFMFPITIFPRQLQIFIKLNPLYVASNSVREIWLYETFNLLSLFYVFLFAIVSMFLGVYFFNKVIKNYGIRGY